MVLDVISNWATILTPFILGLLGFFFSRSLKRQEKALEDRSLRLEKFLDLQAKFQEDRTALYFTVLKPFIVAAIPVEILNKNREIKVETSTEVI